ncbi:ribonuclease T2-like [Trichogramma pretiosum]|uniref:ribonuclease T2-like n=1 Tax=Trichogramma pretiosum TaxID=7493 RepID=UPI000C71C61A|nr:ribonuclease T2-like [Trichogramma pretiosum]
MDSKKLIMDIFKMSKTDPKIVYDHFVLSLMWPQGSCHYVRYEHIQDENERMRLIQESTKKTCSECNMPTDKRNWTIHGLWPSSDTLTEKEKIKHLYYCREDEVDEGSFSTDLKKNLKSKWISFGKRSDSKFRRYEWNKHGTCVKIDDLNSPKKYFRRTVELYLKYQPGIYLHENARIISGGTYPIKLIHDRLKKFLGAIPTIVCYQLKNGSQYIREIRICLDKELDKPINCKYTLSSCYPSKDPEKKGVIEAIYQKPKEPCSNRRYV